MSMTAIVLSLSPTQSSCALGMARIPFAALASGMEVRKTPFSVSMTSTFGPITGEAEALPRSARSYCALAESTQLISFPARPGPKDTY